MRILVVDDEIQITRLLEISFASKSWETLSCKTATDGLDAARSFKPDVILLDLNLPDMSGEDALLKIRSWSSVPIIIVSVRDSEDDIVRLLENGADDYIVKPFYLNVLIARILAVHRRRSNERELSYRFGKVFFKFGERDIVVNDKNYHLTPTEYAVFSVLARNAGKIITRDSILKEVWGPSWAAEEGSLRVYISSLRKKIEIDPSKPEILLTELGVGYRLPAPDSDL